MPRPKSPAKASNSAKRASPGGSGAGIGPPQETEKPVLSRKGGAVALCLAGRMSPLLAAILMPLSSLLTTSMAARV